MNNLGSECGIVSALEDVVRPIVRILLPQFSATVLLAWTALPGILSAQTPADTSSPTPSQTRQTASESLVAPNPPRTGSSAMIAFSPGTPLRVKLEKSIDARKAEVGDQVTAKTIEDLKTNPAKLATKCCQVIGHIVEVAPHQGNSISTLKIVFDKLILKNGSEVALPATIQALGFPDQFSSTNLAMMSGAGGIGPPIGNQASQNAMVGGGNPANYVGGRMPGGTPADPDAKLPLDASGVIGISGLTLSQGPAQDSVLTAHKKNVKLEDGTQMVLRVTYLPGREITTSAQSYLNPGHYDLAQIDFGVMYLGGKGSASARAKKDQENQQQIDAGVLSALDLKAPENAINEFNDATTFLKEQNFKDAIRSLQKAIALYPNFVAAHINLGKAYLNQDDAKSAKNEFETAAKLDSMFAGSFLNLGRLALSESDYKNAQSNLEVAAFLRPRDAVILSSLAYAEERNQQYQQALETTRRVHELEHKGMASVHSIGASAALALNDFQAMERELNLLLSEDPNGPLAPVARRNLEVLSYSKEPALAAAGVVEAQPTTVVSDSQPLRTFPNAERLKKELRSLDEEGGFGNCDDCGKHGGLAEDADLHENAVSDLSPNSSGDAKAGWTVRQRVEEVALFFNASQHGHMVSDLKASDVEVLDNDRPPEKVAAFVPQSKLPLRMALLVDTSGSVHEQFAFEKRAATRFMQKILRSTSDIAFIAGFSVKTTVTQDFTANQNELAEGIRKLANGGGTSLFDAVSLACWKLAEYPGDDRVARVIVILSDGEDNSSHTTLKQVIQIAEKTNVAIYTINTKEDRGPRTDADKILEALGERSGGAAITMPTLGSSFDKVDDLIRSRYFIAYKPANFQPDGTYRTIRISAHRNGEPLQVRARKGYHARLEVNSK